MSDETQKEAEAAVAATTDSYGGPVSDEELADVYLPEGQHEVHDTASEGATAGQVVAEAEESKVDPPD